jgi:fatty acid desaturase
LAEVSVREGFFALRDELRALGCFEHAPWRSVFSLGAHLALSAACFILCSQAPLVAGAPLFVLGSFFFYRLGWLMHDAAHGAVFSTRQMNERFAALTAGILGEFPSGWRYGHNRHHAAPNVQGRDMDQAERWDPTRRYSSVLGAIVGVLLLSKFKGVYLPKTLLLLGLRDGYFCFRYSRRSFRRELCASLLGFACQLAFFTWCFGVVGLLLFVLHTGIGMLYLNTAFAGNHYDLPTFDEARADELDFAELQIRTSRNYAGGLWARYAFGGLEHQIEHHLFPAMPRHRFVRAAPFVRRYCERVGLPYEVLPFSECVARMLRFHVDEVASAPERAL